MMVQLDQGLANSFVHLGMTDKQERQMEDLVGNFMKRLIGLLDRDDENHDALQKLGKKLRQLSKQGTPAARRHRANASPMTAAIMPALTRPRSRH